MAIRHAAASRGAKAEPQTIVPLTRTKSGMKSQKLLVALVTSSFLCISGVPGKAQDANQSGATADDIRI